MKGVSHGEAVTVRCLPTQIKGAPIDAAVVGKRRSCYWCVYSDGDRAWKYSGPRITKVCEVVNAA